MLTPQQTWSSIAAHVKRLPAVGRPLETALGHVLAEDIVADRDSPPADRSAMDGYAARADDLVAEPAMLTVVGEIPAGVAPSVTVEPGTCVRIFTGAGVPPGADTVVRLEDTTVIADGAVRVDVAPRRGTNVFRQGENARRGDVVIKAGTALGPAQLAACAALGRAELRVFGKPSVAVVTSGRELLDAGAAVDEHQERDSNQILLRAGLLDAGFVVAGAHRAADERAAVAEKLRTALGEANVVVLSGGVSVGAYDFVPGAVADVGGRILIHGVAMKPGKPFLFALTGKGQPIFGLPGNPLAAATTLHEFVLPALRHMAGVGGTCARPVMRARLRTAVANKPGRQRYVLAALSWHSGTAEVSVVTSQSSADVIAGARADGAIVVPADTGPLEEGVWVDFRPWRKAMSF